MAGKSLNLAQGRFIACGAPAWVDAKFLIVAAAPDQAEKHRRDFHRLLMETGFR